MTEVSLHGINTSRKAKSVTHVSGTKCHLSLRLGKLWRSIKYDEVYLHAYNTASEARAGIGRYLTFYHGQRSRSSLDQQTPDQAYFNALPPMVGA